MRAAVLQLITDSEKENSWNCVYCNDKEIYFSDIIAWLNFLRLNGYKNMKKFFITIAPIFVTLSAIMWILWGLKGVLEFFIALFVTIVIAIFIGKWVEFIDKHIKD